MDPPIDKVLYCYQVYQPNLFGDLQKAVPHIEFHKGLPSGFGDGSKIIVLDDLMTEVSTSDELVKAFSIYSHHNNISIIFLTQNFFNKGNTRNLTLNCKYIVAMKNPRDTTFIQFLGRQMNGNKNNIPLNEAYADAMKKPYGYVVIDLSQTQNDMYRYRSSLFAEDCTVYVK